jgi:hypothetical protein
MGKNAKFKKQNSKNCRGRICPPILKFKKQKAKSKKQNIPS